MSFSAPAWSRTTRESVSEEVANAIREGTLALISPVTTSTEGRCVARTRCIPAARASHPLQRLGGLLRVGDDRRDEVWNPLVSGQLNPLGIHQDHAHLITPIIT